MIILNTVLRIEKIAPLIKKTVSHLFTSIKEMIAIVTILVCFVLIIFLIVLSFFICQCQAQTKVHAQGHFTLHQKCQNEMQESENMKNLKKMKTLRSNRKLSSEQPESEVSMYYLNDVESGITEIMASIEKDLDLEGLVLKGPEAQRHLRNSAIEEWTNSFVEKKAKY